MIAATRESKAAAQLLKDGIQKQLSDIRRAANDAMQADETSTSKPTNSSSTHRDLRTHSKLVLGPQCLDLLQIGAEVEVHVVERFGRDGAWLPAVVSARHACGPASGTQGQLPMTFDVTYFESTTDATTGTASTKMGYLTGVVPQRLRVPLNTDSEQPSRPQPSTQPVDRDPKASVEMAPKEEIKAEVDAHTGLGGWTTVSTRTFNEDDERTTWQREQEQRLRIRSYVSADAHTGHTEASEAMSLTEPLGQSLAAAAIVPSSDDRERRKALLSVDSVLPSNTNDMLQREHTLEQASIAGGKLVSFKRRKMQNEPNLLSLPRVVTADTADPDMPVPPTTKLETVSKPTVLQAESAQDAAPVKLLLQGSKRKLVCSAFDDER